MHLFLSVLLLAPAVALADIAPSPDCGCSAGTDPVALGFWATGLAMAALVGRRTATGTARRAP